MPLTPGTRLGPYEVLSSLGAGGMGEVYKARDTRLDRFVAVKVLLGAVAADPDRRERFEREARAVSALNHPHICALYDVGRQDDLDYLVMELVEGETLDDRLAKGPLSIEYALKLGSEIANALARAHRQGIVHRDLKPGNVMLTRQGAKLLDFGLARMESPDVSTAGTVLATAMPTQPRPLTQAGTVLGTFQYMAPEQLEGREADARTDIFAFGALLYEAITGRKAFEGKSQASLISAIMTGSPPPISSLQPTTPPALDRVIRTCLAKDPEERWQTAQDLAAELKWIAGGGSQVSAPVPTVAPRRRSRERWAWAAAAVLGLVAAGAVGRLLTLPEPVREETRFVIDSPRGLRLAWPRISPDGRMVAFVGIDGQNRRSIWVRRIDAFAPVRLEGTDGVNRPFWSPDSRYLGFFAGTQLKKVPAGGGPTQLITEATGSDGSWSATGVILFDGAVNDPLRRVPDSGGTAEVVSVKAGDNVVAAWPAFLPDGKHFLFVTTDNLGPKQLGIGTLDSAETVMLGPIASRAEYAAGRIYYVAQSTLVSRPFSLQSLAFTGEATPVASDTLQVEPSGRTDVSVSDAGHLAYVAAPPQQRGRLVWIDRGGREISTVGDPALYTDIDLSRDDSRAVVTTAGSGLRGPAQQTVWVVDMKRGTSSRVTFGDAPTGWPVISPDGAYVYYSVGSGARLADRIVRRLSSGAGNEEVVLADTGSDVLVATDVAKDGRLMYQRFDSGLNNADLLTIQPGASPELPFLVSPIPVREEAGRLSPDGRWVAYRSNESGRGEVYVQSFTPGGGKWQVSRAGGRYPKWRADGREIFFDIADSFWAAPVAAVGAALDIGTPVKLFEHPIVHGERERNRWSVSADGQRFLLNAPSEETEPARIQVVLDGASSPASR